MGTSANPLIPPPPGFEIEPSAAGGVLRPPPGFELETEQRRPPGPQRMAPPASREKREKAREFVDLGESAPHRLAAERERLEEAATLGEQERGLQKLIDDFTAGSQAPFGVPGAPPPARSFVEGVIGLRKYAVGKVGPALRAAKLPSEQDFPQVAAVQRAFDAGALQIAGAVDFLTSPAGVAAGATMGKGPAFVRQIVKAGFSAHMAIQSWDIWRKFVHDPTPEGFGEASVLTALTLLPTAHEIARFPVSAKEQRAIFDFRARVLETTDALKNRMDRMRGTGAFDPGDLQARAREARPVGASSTVPPPAPRAAKPANYGDMVRSLDDEALLNMAGAESSRLKRTILEREAAKRGIAPAAPEVSDRPMGRKEAQAAETTEQTYRRLFDQAEARRQARTQPQAPAERQAQRRRGVEPPDTYQAEIDAVARQLGIDPARLSREDRAAIVRLAEEEYPHGVPPVTDVPRGTSLKTKAEAGPLPPITTPAPPPGFDLEESPAAAEAGAVPGGGNVVRMPTKDIHADPVRFQFKLGSGEGGAGEELREVKKFDREAAGVGLVWRDPADGQTYAVNMHNRLALANRLGEPEMDVRYTDAKTAAEARVRGALMNIREGRGTAIDAAKLFRDSGITESDLEKEGVSLKGKVAREGVALGKLDAGIFQQVVQGEMPVARGVAIGEALGDHAEQKALVHLLDRAEKKGKRLTNEELGELTRFVKTSGQQVENTATLFGEEEVRQSLAIEKAEISSFIKQRLKQERRLFGAVSTEARAQDLGRAGNVIRAEENARIAEQASQGEETYNKLSTLAGPIGDVLETSARELAQGGNANAVKERAYTAVRAEVSKTLGGAKERSAARVEGLGREGPAAPDRGRPETQEVAGKALLLRPFEGGKPFRGGQPFGKSIRDSQVIYKPARGGKPPTLYVNEQAAEVLRKSLSVDEFSGATLHPDAAAKVVATLDAWTRQYQADPMAARKLKLLRDSLVKAVTRPRGTPAPAIVVEAGPGASPGVVKTALREERFHFGQSAMQGGLGVEGHVDPQLFGGDPAGRKAMDALTAAGYGSHPDVLAAEIGVRLAYPDRWNELEIGREDARRLTKAYYRALAEKHGDQAWPIIRQLHRTLKRTYEHAREEPQALDREGDRRKQGEPSPPLASVSGGRRESLRPEIRSDVPAGQSRLDLGADERVAGPVRHRLSNENEADSLYIEWREGAAVQDLASRYNVTPAAARKILMRYERQFRLGTTQAQKPIEERLRVRKKWGITGGGGAGPPNEPPTGLQNVNDLKTAEMLVRGQLAGELSLAQAIQDETVTQQQLAMAAAFASDGARMARRYKILAGADSLLKASRDLSALVTRALRPDVRPLYQKTGKLAGIEKATGDALTKSAKMPGRDVGSVEGTPLFPDDRQKPLFMRKPPKGRPAGAKDNYSGLGAVKDVLIRNLSQLEKASPEAHTAGLRAAGSAGQTAVLLRGAVPKIERELGDASTWQEFRGALIESRLQGIRERWGRLAGEADAMSDKDLADSFSRTMMLLENIAGKKGIPQDVDQTAAALLEAGDFAGLRSFLASTFRDAGASVGSVMPAAQYAQVTAHPNFVKGLNVYKSLIEKPVSENHALNEGIFSDALGPLDTYYPLVALQPSHKALAGQGRRTPYRKPRNIANYFATGLAEQYDISVEALGDRLNRAVRANNKAALLETLGEEGLLRKLAQGEAAGDVVQIGGEDFPAEIVEVRPDRQVFKDGKPSYVPAQRALVPRWLAKELKPILEKRGEQPGMAARIVNAINEFSLVGPFDLVFHSTNVIGAMVSNTPFVGRDVASKTVGNLPFTKLATSVIKIVNTNPMNEAAVADLTEMARIGLVPDRYASETYSKRFAEQTGAELKLRGGVPTGFGPLLYGPKGLDVRARLIMYRLSKEVNPAATPQEHFKFVSQLGNYVRDLQGTVERAMKGSGVSPFYTAGSTMLRNGINSWLGTSPLPGGGGDSGAKRAGQRLAAQLSGGAVGLVALWALASKAYDDEHRWPWEDPKSRLLQIPLKPEHRNSATGKAMYGHRPNTTAYVNFAFFSPLVSRGARALGVTGAYDARQLGATPGQAFEEAQRSSMNAFLHPFVSGPLARAPFVFATGREPYISSLRDERGQFGPQLMPTITKAPAGLPTLGQRALEASLGVNSFFQDVAAGVGLGHQAERSVQQGNRWLRLAADITMPRLFGTTVDPMSRAAGLARQQRTIENERGDAMRELRETIDRGGDAKKLAREAVAKGTLSRDDLRTIIKEQELPVLERRFRALGIEQALAAYRVASKAEKAQLLPILKEKLKRHLKEAENLPAVRREEIREKARAAFAR